MKILRNALGLVTTTIGFLLAFFLVHLPHGPEHWSADLRTAYLADRLESQHPHIAIVEINEQTLARSDYLEPVDRGTLAAIVRALDDAEVKIIGLDFIFDRHTEVAKDKDLLQAIKGSRAQIVLGAIDDRVDLNQERRAFQAWFLKEASRPVGHLYFGEHKNPFIISDQVVREMADPTEVSGHKSFAEVIARIDGSYREPGSHYISWLRAPKDGRERFLTLSGEDILGHSLPSRLPLKDLLRGKIVLIGGNFYPGTFVHAQVLAQLSDPLRRPIYTPSWPLWLIVVAAAAGVGFRVGRSNRLRKLSPWVEIASVITFIIVGVLAFLFGRFVFPFVSVVLAWGWGETLAHFFHSEKNIGTKVRNSA
jgi:CHASE2 domain-containing sensor protein